MSEQIKFFSNLSDNNKTTDIRQKNLKEEIKFDKLAVKKLTDFNFQRKPRTVKTTTSMLEETRRSRKPVGTRSRAIHEFCRVYC